MSKNYIESNVLEYRNIKCVYGYDVDVKGETDETYYEKKFRVSSDNILWSDYKDLTNKNLSKTVIYDNTLYIQYKFTKVGDGDLSVESISLDIDYIDGNDSGIPECHWMTYNSQNRYTPQIVYSSNGSNMNLFNPYAVGSSYSFYQQMSTLVSNMFGFCVVYFKTEANARTRDVVLKEYSIEHVIDKQNIKILVPDNQLPTRELQFNTMMIDYPVQFEIHIVKSEFWKVFGEDSHPDPHDYLYMQNYMNKMYMVDAVSEPDDFGYQGSYWRVSLVPYQEMSSVKFNDENLLNDTESLIFSAEKKFEDEVNVEIADTRKDNQLNDMGDFLEGQDFLRIKLDPDVRIRDEKIYNDWTIISKQFYDLSTIEKCNIACEYKYRTGFTDKDERMISFLFRPLNTENNISENILINDITHNKPFVRITVDKWSNLFIKGNYVKISRTSNLDGFAKIMGVDKKNKTIDVEAKFTKATKAYSCAKVVAYEANEFINIRSKKKTLLDLTQIDNSIRLRMNGFIKTYTFDEFSGFENKWYAIMLGINRGMSNMWLYEINGSEKKENHRSKIKLIGKCTNDIGTFDFGKECFYDITSCNLHLTNFRLWSKLCEEDKHELLLSQYVIDDSHNALIVDNAQNELLLNNKWS